MIDTNIDENKTMCVGGRPQLLNARSFTGNNTINSKSIDESKFTLTFCVWGKCDLFGHGVQNCYCCPDGSRKEYCHQTMEECRANCALCRPYHHLRDR